MILLLEYSCCASFFCLEVCYKDQGSFVIIHHFSFHLFCIDINSSLYSLYPVVDLETTDITTKHKLDNNKRKSIGSSKYPGLSAPVNPFGQRIYSDQSQTEAQDIR